MVIQFGEFIFAFLVAHFYCFFLLHLSYLLHPLHRLYLIPCIFQSSSLASSSPLRFQCISLASCDNLYQFGISPPLWFIYIFSNFWTSLGLWYWINKFSSSLPLFASYLLSSQVVLHIFFLFLWWFCSGK